jgi:hypothetical protein
LGKVKTEFEAPMKFFPKVKGEAQKGVSVRVKVEVEVGSVPVGVAVWEGEEGELFEGHPFRRTPVKRIIAKSGRTRFIVSPR